MVPIHSFQGDLAMIQPLPVSMIAARPRLRQRTALIASADRNFRQRLNQILTGLRWQVREAEGGAQAWTEAETAQPEAVIVDSWLPDLELNEFLRDFRIQFPQVDLIAAGGDFSLESPRGPYRQELLYALRRSQEGDTAAWNSAPVLPPDIVEGEAAAGKQIAAFPETLKMGEEKIDTALNLPMLVSGGRTIPIRPESAP